ncbi:MAG: ABC-F family ATP-binding cassette domain-containing protein, partial [Stomatobaculum sp.]|nr:ABC-F family ATP-binding cassette domain-containing protein [Stomatobaculum sp.]
SFLMNYSGAVVIVSHDRYFLDRIVNKVIDIENGEVTAYTGNYTQFAEKKAAVREAKLRAYLNQQQELKHQEEVIAKLKSFNREKSIRRAESREKMLNKTERLERPGEIKADMGLRFTMEESSGNDVLEVSGISKSFGSLKLFENLSFELKRGEHAAIIGDNGAGKTTILKILNGLLQPDTGSVTMGARVMIAYYDQEHAVLHPEKTIFEEVQDTWPDMNNTEVRSMLAAFLFTGDDAFKRIADLSGGERGRVSLAKLMLSRANFLILDEPTNHLDMVSKEVLEQAIRSFPGTVLYVSHDRYFINRTATRILDLTQGKLLNYIGNYDYYLEKKADVERASGLTPAGRTSADGAASARVSGTGAASASASFTSSASSASDGLPAQDAALDSSSSGKDDWLNAKAQKAKEKKRKAALQKCEGRIHELEEDLKEIENEFLKPELQRDAAALLQLQRRKEADEEELEGLYEEWEALASEEDV